MVLKNRLKGLIYEAFEFANSSEFRSLQWQAGGFTTTIVFFLWPHLADNFLQKFVKASVFVKFFWNLGSSNFSRVTNTHSLSKINSFKLSQRKFLNVVKANIPSGSGTTKTSGFFWCSFKELHFLNRFALSVFSSVGFAYLPWNNFVNHFMSDYSAVASRFHERFEAMISHSNKISRAANTSVGIWLRIRSSYE